MIDYSMQKGKTITLRTRNEEYLFHIENIVFIECDSYLVIVHTMDNEKQSFTKTLKELDNDLGKYGFLRISQKALVNMKYYKKCKNKSGKFVYLSNETELNVSQRKMANFKELSQNK